MSDDGVKDRGGRDTGRLSAPGQLSQGNGMTPGGGVITADLPAEDLPAYAAQYGLTPTAARPGVVLYLRQLWRRRSFIMAFATARNIAMYTEARLGQLWQILTPLLNAAVYFLIFGLLLKVSRGIPDYLAFLVTGVFVFNFTQRAFISTSTVVTESLPLIRALQFPRASLPLAYVIIELQQMMLSMAVLVIIVLISPHEPVTWYWLLVIPALLLQTIFNVGVGLFVARLGSQVNDFSQLLPFLLRTWMYVSGVLFSIGTLRLAGNYWVVNILQLNPAALYITLIRNALLTTQRESAPGSKAFSKHLCGVWVHQGHTPGATLAQQMDSAHCPMVTNPDHFWYFAVGWAVVALVVGFFFFWRSEAKYGRG